MWAQSKRAFTNLFCLTLKDVSQFIDQFTQKLTSKSVKETCAFEYIFTDEIWTKI
jgi:hypothetical protein